LAKHVLLHFRDQQVGKEFFRQFMEDGKEAATEWLSTNPAECYSEQINKPNRGCSDIDVELDFPYHVPSTIEDRLHLLRRDATRAEIEEKCGGGIGATLLFLAGSILWSEVNAIIYGGFVRDFVVRNYVVREMDLDVVVPGSQWRTVAESIIDFCRKQGLVATDGYRTANVHEIKVHLMKPEAANPKEAVCIEVIKAEWKFGKPDATVDFDVNNLKLKRADDDTTCLLDLAYPLARNADKLDLILQHLEKKQLVVVEPLYSTVGGSKKQKPRMMKRWTKMVRRGWKVVNT